MNEQATKYLERYPSDIEIYLIASRSIGSVEAEALVLEAIKQNGRITYEQDPASCDRFIFSVRSHTKALDK